MVLEDTDPEKILQDLDSTSSSDDFYAKNPRNTQVSEWSHWQGFPLPTFTSHECQNLIRLEDGQYICGCDSQMKKRRSNTI